MIAGQAERSQSNTQKLMDHTEIRTSWEECLRPQKVTEVVARGDCFSDADGGGSNGDDEHLVVA